MNSEVPDLHLEARDGLALITFDRPDSKVNLLASPVMLRLEELLGDIETRIARGEIRTLLIRSAKPGNFIAGADLDELARFEDARSVTAISRRGQEIFLRLERLRVPTVAAIDGTCVGGGLELVLACDYRVASRDRKTRLGLPETRLGLCPGLGGTVRLPRLVGLRPALDLILTGRQIGAIAAYDMGLVDRVLDAPTFDEEAVAIATAFARDAQPLETRRRSAVARLIKDGLPARWLTHRLMRRSVFEHTQGHYPALPEALDVTVRGLGMSVKQAHDAEAQAFGKLAATPESKNLISAFRLVGDAKKRRPTGTAATVNHAAVIGAGVMGAGIAELFAFQSIPVQVVDTNENLVRTGIDRARALLERVAKRVDWSDEDLQTRRDCLVAVTDFADLGQTDLIVEAVLERMDVKRAVLGQLEQHIPASTVLATNTTALSISELQEGLDRPARACGLHFFNPPHRMQLVEVVRGARTDDDTVATAFQLALRLGKTPIVVEDSPGFVVNRVLAAYLTEVGHLLQTGMGVLTIDQIMRRFGMPMGPLRLVDEIGFDVVAQISETMRRAYGERFVPAPIVAEVLNSGVTGRKGGGGFYIYEGGKAKRVNRDVAERLPRSAEVPAVEPADARERMVLRIINEATLTLDDGVVDDPETLDVAMIVGAGFPPFRGGLLRYADSLGLDRIVDRLQHYATLVDSRFDPAPGLVERKMFYDY